MGKTQCPQCMYTAQRHPSMQTMPAILLQRDLPWKQSVLAGDYFHYFTTEQEEAKNDGEYNFY